MSRVSAESSVLYTTALSESILGGKRRVRTEGEDVRQPPARLPQRSGPAPVTTVPRSVRTPQLADFLSDFYAETYRHCTCQSCLNFISKKQRKQKLLLFPCQLKAHLFHPVWGQG